MINANRPQAVFSTILLTNVDKHVAHLQFNRPNVKNAFSLETGKEFIKALKLLEEDTSVRCVVLSGIGPDFTSGVDLKSFMSVYSQLQETDDAGRKAKLLRNIIEQFQLPFKQMHLFTKPIICVQHGLSYGLAMELAACSDIRYCSSDTKLAIREVLIGIAADVGSLQELPRLFSNQSLLRELIYTGRELTIDEATQTGFVSKVFDTKEKALEEALKTAKIIASRSPVAVQGSKQNLRFSRDKSFQDGLDYNAVWNMSMLQSEDVVKAVTAIMIKAMDDTVYDDY